MLTKEGRSSKYWTKAVRRCHGSRCIKLETRYSPYVAPREMTMSRNVGLLKRALVLGK